MVAISNRRIWKLDVNSWKPRKCLGEQISFQKFEMKIEDFEYSKLQTNFS